MSGDGSTGGGKLGQRGRIGGGGDGRRGGASGVVARGPLLSVSLFLSFILFVISLVRALPSYFVFPWCSQCV